LKRNGATERQAGRAFRICPPVHDGRRGRDYPPVEGYSYNQKIELFDGISVRFIDVGHLLGSSSIEVSSRRTASRRKSSFRAISGAANQPLIRDPQYITQADYVVMESTIRHPLP
jgi:Cft2 family RNA processing exonuclease